MENYYQDLLASDSISGNHVEQQSNSDSKSSTTDPISMTEKWKGQIEKVIACMLFQIFSGSFIYLALSVQVLVPMQDLPRTFPGHPALDDDGRNALRRLLTAYARHNPSVGYCQVLEIYAASSVCVCVYIKFWSLILLHLLHWLNIQAMNFFAAFLLLLMPEENAFW